MYGLPAVLSILALAAILRREPMIAATAGLLLANWGINTALVSITGDVSPWLVFMVVDYLAAIGLFALRETQWQSAIIAVYAAELIVHAAFGASSGGAWPQYRYWWALFYLGWAQAVITGGWLACEMARDRLRARGRASPAVVAGGETQP